MPPNKSEQGRDGQRKERVMRVGPVSDHPSHPPLQRNAGCRLAREVLPPSQMEKDNGRTDAVSRQSGRRSPQLGMMKR
ncbi:hypothetical protein E4U22_007323 [Claviceps purpurea]|nr:hypothetical protein E4U27_005813 [Claviceps purpurea]KAG6324848.1 hypothetical protein E4U22_007323 [Claviceps purpurea]